MKPSATALNESALNPEDMRKFKDQVIITLVKRLAVESAEGYKSLVIPVAEIDSTGQDMLDMESNPTTGEFTFTLSKKN